MLAQRLLLFPVAKGILKKVTLRKWKRCWSKYQANNKFIAIVYIQWVRPVSPYVPLHCPVNHPTPLQWFAGCLASCGSDHSWCLIPPNLPRYLWCTYECGDGPACPYDWDHSWPSGGILPTVSLMFTYIYIRQPQPARQSSDVISPSQWVIHSHTISPSNTNHKQQFVVLGGVEWQFLGEQPDASSWSLDIEKTRHRKLCSLNKCDCFVGTRLYLLLSLHYNGIIDFNYRGSKALIWSRLILEACLCF